jgi:cyanophycinase
MQTINTRASKNEVILVGTSAGSMAMCSPIYGDGNSYGHLYFAASVGLAPKSVADGGVNGSGTQDTRNGTDGLQYDYNGGMMAGFGFVPFLVDTHFDQRGRLGRMVPALVQMRKDFGIGVDESTGFFYEDGRGKVYGRNGVFVVDLRYTRYNTKTYFSIYNVTLSYLTSGD